MSREDKFYKLATTLPVAEKKDIRDERSIPELEKIAALRDEGRVQDAVDYGKGLARMHPDSDLPPFMVAYMYYQRDFPNEALEVALEALKRVPRKYRLYAVAGLAELDRGNTEEALVWLCRSVLAQCAVRDFQEADPFLYLAHAADLLDLSAEADALFEMADAIEPGRSRLFGEPLTQLAAIKASWAQEPFRRALSHIVAEHLQA